jgi:hypothetical protein
MQENYLQRFKKYCTIYHLNLLCMLKLVKGLSKVASDALLYGGFIAMLISCIGCASVIQKTSNSDKARYMSSKNKYVAKYEASLFW